MLPFVLAQSVMMPMMGFGFWSTGNMGAVLGISSPQQRPSNELQ
jgi:hypothetical protein